MFADSVIGPNLCFAHDCLEFTVRLAQSVEVLIDSFGNIVTNIDGPSLRGAKFGQRIAVEVGGECLRIPFVRTYGDVEEGAALALIGSSGMLEIAINRGSMSGRLSSAKEGTRVAVEPMPR